MRFKNLLVASALMTAVPMVGATPDPQVMLVNKASKTLQRFLTADPERELFRAHLADARAAMIIPVMIKARFVVGASGGNAVLLAREPANAHLERPSFLPGGRIQCGTAGRRTKGRNHHDRQDGGSAQVADAKLGQAGDWKLDCNRACRRRYFDHPYEDMVSFVRAKGAFAGLALKGTAVEVYTEFNQAYYGKVVAPEDILIDHAAVTAA